MSADKNYATRSDEKRTLWSMKITPRLKYLASVAARANEKTLSSFVESSLEESFKAIKITDDQEGSDGKTIPGKTLADLADSLYRGSEADRFIALLKTAPWLFSDEDDKLRRIMMHSDYYFPQLRPGQHVWMYEHIREHWTMLAAIRDGEADIYLLPVEAQPKPGTEFGLINEKERIAQYKADPEKFKRESLAYQKAMKGKGK